MATQLSELVAVPPIQRSRVVEVQAPSPEPVATQPYVPPVSESPVQSLDQLPDRARTIVSGLTPGASPQQRLAATDAMIKQEKETADYSPNVKPQWGKMLFSALDGRWGEVYKYYNGGATREEAARDFQGNQYWKEFNEIGSTGVIKDRSGKVLSKQQKDELISRGGVITKSDDQALKTSGWMNAQTNAELFNRGLTSQLDIIRNDAYNAARTAGAANQNIDEQLTLAKQLQPVLDHFGTLNPQARQKLLGTIARYNTNANNIQRLSENIRNANVGGLQGISQTGNVGVGAGQFMQPDGSVMPAGPGGKLTGSAGVSATGMGQSQFGVSGRELSGQQALLSQQLQEQQNLQSAIMAELQGVIKTPEQFQNFVRFQSLNSTNEAAYKNIPDRVRPPGYVDIPEIDPTISGSASIIANRVNQLRNNALMAAWSNELFKAQREALASGKPMDVDSVSDKFQKSDIFKAINNTYGARLEFERTGRAPQFPKGTLRVDRSNRLIKD